MRMKKNERSQVSAAYQTHDLDLASTLICENCSLMKISLTGNRAMFHFEANARISKIVSKFWDDTIKVPPLKYSNTRKNLKSRIYSMKR